VVAVPVGEHSEVQLGEIHPQCSDVMFKNLSIPTRVEKDPLTLVLHQRGVSPCFRHGWRLAKRVVQDRDAIVGLTSTQTRKQKERKHKTQRDTGSQVVLREGLCVSDYSGIFSGSQERPGKSGGFSQKSRMTCKRLAAFVEGDDAGGAERAGKEWACGQLKKRHASWSAL